MTSALIDQILQIYSQKPRVAILMSGKGSNADAILRHAYRYKNVNFVTICTDRNDSNARALSAKYDTDFYLLEGDVATSENRERYFQELTHYLTSLNIDTIVYAGFMKISTPAFVRRFPGINVHPADLTICDAAGMPKYTGMNAVPDAVSAGEAYLASTAHVVDQEVDCGVPIAVSRHLPLKSDHLNHQQLHEQLKIHAEHLLYPRILERLAKGQIEKERLPYSWSDLEDLPQLTKGELFARILLGKAATTDGLELAYLAQDYSSEVGFDFSHIEQVMVKVKEEFNELMEAYEARDSNFEHFLEEIGDCFFSLVNLCRFAHVQPEMVVKRNVNKYLNRCRRIEDRLTNEKRNWSGLTQEEINTMWKEAKKDEYNLS